MKKTNEKQAQVENAPATVEQATPTTFLTNEEIIEMVEKNPKDRYSNWSGERTIQDEADELRGLDMLKGIDSKAVELAKLWHNRSAYREKLAEIRKEHEAAGIDTNTWMQENVREQVEGNEISLQTKAISRLRYLLNYHKPREGSKSKKNLITIKIGEDFYRIDKVALTALKNAAKDKNELRELLLKAAKPIEATDELSF